MPEWAGRFSSAVLPVAGRFHHAFVDEAEVRDGHGALLQLALHLFIFLFHLRGDGGAAVFQRLVEVGLGHTVGRTVGPADGIEAGAAGDVLEVRAGEALGLRGDGLEIHVVRQRHGLGVDAENVLAASLVGRADVDQFVEPAGPEQRGVDQRGPVCRADDDDGGQLLHPVHFGEDGVNHPRRDLRLAGTRSAGRNQ